MTLRVAKMPLPVAFGATLLLSTPLALAHSGHGAPDVHAHTGSPAMLAVLAISALGLAALVPLTRLVRRRRRHRQS
ncbi:hypothetical protein ACGTNG_05875 [Halomonas sp. 1390]|uniref:hypothetical protein n=1 Tax=Halomonas sp. B23F22_3 TaxID=3459516 RepID=UPI00373E7979